jgi:MFS family permease
MAHSLGLIGVAGIVSNALGPLLAEEIARKHGFGSVFNASMIFLVVSFFCMYFTREGIKQEPLKKSDRPTIPRGLSLITILIISSLPIFHGAVRGSVVNFIALFGKSIPLERVGPFFLAFSLAAILTRVRFGDVSDRYGRKRIILPAACIISLNLFWISTVRSTWVFILNGFIAGLGQGLIFPALSTYIIDIMGRENKGLALSLYLSLFDVGMGLGSPVFGWISDLFGYRKMYVVAGLLLLVSTIVFTLKAPGLPLGGGQATEKERVIL